MLTQMPSLQVLFWKKRAEEELQRSGIDYTIVRPGDTLNVAVVTHIIIFCFSFIIRDNALINSLSFLCRIYTPFLGIILSYNS